MRYRVKWFGKPKTTWEPATNLGNGAIDEYENSQAQLIVGTKMADSLYAVKYKDGRGIQMLPLQQIMVDHPKLLANFLFERIHVEKRQQQANCQDDQNANVESKGLIAIDELPTEIIGKILCISCFTFICYALYTCNLFIHENSGCTDIGGLNFWCEFGQSNRKILPIAMVNERPPVKAMVVNYSREHLVSGVSDASNTQVMKFFDGYPRKAFF